jgi:hypothetical protein
MFDVETGLVGWTPVFVYERRQIPWQSCGEHPFTERRHVFLMELKLDGERLLSEKLPCSVVWCFEWDVAPPRISQEQLSSVIEENT